MTRPTAQNATISTLNDVRQLLDEREGQQALKKINDFLEQHPEDLEAKLLKARICLETETELDYVAAMLNSLEGDISQAAVQLRADVESAIVECLEEGRRGVGRTLPGRARASFERAFQLSRGDPAVALAVGHSIANPSPSEVPAPSFTSFRQMMLLQKGQALVDERAEAAERYFRLALEGSTRDQGVHLAAFQSLIALLLGQQHVGVALDLLAKTEPLKDEDPQLRPGAARTSVLHLLWLALALLRLGHFEQAGAILDRCCALDPFLATGHFCRGEAFRLSGDHPGAIEAFGEASRLADRDAAPPSIPAILEALNSVEHTTFRCPFCGKSHALSVDACRYCGTPFQKRELLIDRYPLEEASDKCAAHVGLAEALAAAGDHGRAVAEFSAAAECSTTNATLAQTLRKRRDECAPYLQSLNGAAAVRSAFEGFVQQGPTSDILRRFGRLCDAQDIPWANLRGDERIQLVRRLMRGGQLKLAIRLSERAFPDMAADPSVEKLRISLTRTIQSGVALRRHEATLALQAGDLESALEMTAEALTLKPDDAVTLVLRGQVQLKSEQVLQSLASFRRALSVSRDSRTRRLAQIGAAAALELNWEFDEALEALAEDAHPDIEAARARLYRRLRGEPAIKTWQTDTLVMHDTLQRSASEPVFHGTFTVALRAVGLPIQASQGAWRDRLLSAAFEFVQVLGSLRNVPGDPIFSLRMISSPDPLLPERGKLTIALIVRVSAEEETECRQLALDLWRTLVDILPSAHEHIYMFEPMADRAELDHVLMPFTVDSVAEIVRREDIPHSEGDRYAVYPYTAGTIDLHNLCWALLRQRGPALVSIQLLPTDLMSWESAALNTVMLDSESPIAEPVLETSARSVVDPISVWWNGSTRWGQAQANRQALDVLRSHAFVLRVSVAGSDRSSPMLAETAAAAFFGPLQSVGDAMYGGYEIVHAERPAEIAVAVRNLHEIDVESWVYTAAPAGAARLRCLVGEREAALVFRLPLPGNDGVPGVAVIDARPVAPPPGMPERGLVLGHSITRAGGMPIRITQASADRRRHTYVVGKTGVGKSTLLQRMALQDIETGGGLAIIDPHGELVDDILCRIPAHRADDVILFDASDEERPIGLNLLESHTEAERHRIVAEFIGLLFRMYDPNHTGIVGPRFEHNVRNAMLTVMSVEGSTLADVVRALTDIDYVRTILPQVTDPLVRNYWERQIANTSEFHKSEILDYIVSKFSRFVGDKLVRNIVGQRQTTLNFREIMDNRKILLVNLSKGKIGPECAQFLGLLFVQRLLLTALSRADVPADARPDFFLYVDEFQNFSTQLFGTILSEGRKYGVAAVVANQYLTQLDREIRDAIFGNVGSLVSFRVGTQDAAILTPEMYPVFGPDDLLNLPRFTAAVKLLVDGMAGRPFTMRTLPDTRPVNMELAKEIRNASRMRYGRDAAVVADDISTRFV